MRLFQRLLPEYSSVRAWQHNARFRRRQQLRHRWCSWISLVRLPLSTKMRCGVVLLPNCTVRQSMLEQARSARKSSGASRDIPTSRISGTLLRRFDNTFHGQPHVNVAFWGA